MSVNAYQPVLDPASSGRMFWFDKHDTRALFGDIRDESWELCDEKPLFGNKQPKQTVTHWIVFMKAGTEEQ